MGLDSRRCTSVVHNDLTCAICLDILSLDCLIDDKDHVYCKTCIVGWFDAGNSKCPIGNEIIYLRSMKVPRIVRNLLSDLMVRCKFEDKGCKDFVKYENLERHEQQCSFNCVQCPKGCGITVKQMELKSHDCIQELKLQVQDLKLKNMELNEKLLEYKENAASCPHCGGSGSSSSNTPPVIIKQKTGFKKLMNPFSKLWPPQMNNNIGMMMSRSCDDLTQAFIFSSVRSSNTQKIPSQQLVSMTSFANQKQILIADANENSLKLIDNKGNYLNTNNLNNLVQVPVSLCTNIAKTEVYVGSYESEEIFVFDSKLCFKRKFGKNLIKKPTCLLVDLNDVLYVGDWSENKVSVWNLKKDEKTSSFDIDSPVAIKSANDKLYVLSRTLAKFNETSLKLERIESGSNCIFLLDKVKYSLVGKIKLNNWIGPAGLHIDTKNNYIFTIAYELDKNQTRSNSRYLYVLNNKNELIKRIYLDGVQFISDMLMLDNRLVFSINDSIKCIELE